MLIENISHVYINKKNISDIYINMDKNMVDQHVFWAHS
jgi:hypothetical protein